MATKLLSMDADIQTLRQFKVFDDFMEFGTDATVADGLWTTTGDTGDATIDADGVGGIVNLLTENVDNDHVVIETAELFKVATDKPIMCLMRAKVNSVTANQAGFMFGLMDAVDADALVDDDTVAASKHQITMRHPDGGTALNVSSVSTASGTYVDNVADVTIADNAWYSYMFLVEPLSSTDKRITFYFDSAGGVNFEQVQDSTTGLLVQHTWSLADTAAATGELSLFATIKAGSAEAQEMAIDYLGAFQLR